MPSDRLETEIFRIRALAACMCLLLAVPAIELARMQIFHAGRYRSSLDRQSIRRVRLPAPRGRILDRNGKCLADTRPSYSIAVYVEELRKPGSLSRTIEAVEAAVHKTGGIIGLRPEIGPEDIRRHIRQRAPLPLVAWRDADWKAISRFAEYPDQPSGVDVFVEPVRTYPMGRLAAHVLGYVGKRDQAAAEEEDPFSYYLPDMTGRYGIESAYDRELAGLAGAQLIRVDAAGFKHRAEMEREAVLGRDITLSIDWRIQRLAEEALSDARGAAVIVEPFSGEILAMASSPSFDPNRFGIGIDPEEWRELLTDEARPLFNRAIQAAYPPGSVFKPVVALAALDSAAASPATTFVCSGSFRIGNAEFDCWQTTGHGAIDLEKAIEQSCNAYFCQLGLLCGHQRIADMARELGFGERTGIVLAAGGMTENPGLVPDEEWKKRRLREGWRPGDTCNMSIGQGFVLATPLQVAMMCACLANGGTLLTPRLVLNPSDGAYEAGRRAKCDRRAIEIVRQGMRDVIENASGTGRRAHVEGVELAGKTGTAEYGPSHARKKYTWMMAFGPYENPRYALAIVVEEGVSGGITVAPRVAQIFRGLLALESHDSAAGAEG